jgi:aryl-alcohol dehydrogenase-like predicted oxidoreductase
MRIDQPTTEAVVHAALEEGVRFFDTADIYAGGLSEMWLGDILGKVRDEVVIATKFGFRIGEGGAPGKVIAACNASLQRLGTDYIDVYHYHEPDGVTPIEETLGALDELVEAGKVREIGHSNVSSEQIQEADRVAVQAGLQRFASVENQYNLLYRAAESDVLPLCEQLEIALIPFFPLASGLLTGKYNLHSAPPAGTRLAWALETRVRNSEGASGRDALEAAINWHPHEPSDTETALDRVSQLADFARIHDRTMLELALGWLAAQPRVATVIAGATTPAQATENARATKTVLTPEELGFLSSL